MTAAVIVLAVAFASSLGVIVWLARSRSLLFDDLEAMAEDKLVHEARADDMEDERNAALAASAKSQSEAAMLRAALVASQAAERAAREEKANALAAIARSASSEQLFELANRMLGQALPGAAAAVPAADDLGDTRPLARVQPADAAEPGPTGASVGE